LEDDVRAHIFDSTGEAYDATQYDEDIKKGDLLLIAKEKVVGIADTWPIAVTKENGKLHAILDVDSFLKSFLKDTDMMIASYLAAQQLIEDLGWEQ
jgi:hypothetical protein